MAAFEGIRVLDFTQGIGGPMACMHLADHGAEVIKIEQPGGDRMAGRPGYLCWNRNKQRLVLDVNSFEGLQSIRSLLATVDAAVFDWAPGEMERHGLDAVSLHALHPQLVHAWLPPYSPIGRWSELPPEDSLLAALGTISSAQFSYEDRPVHLVTPQVSYAQGMLSAGAIASALLNRARTGRREAVVVSGLHAVASVHSGLMIKFGEVMDRHAGSSRGGVPNYRLYQCADGQWLFLGTLTPPFFIRALEAMDLMDILLIEGVDGDFAKLLQPPLSAKAIARLDERFAEKPREEWLRILHEAGVPRAPVGDREDFFRGEQVAANGMHLELKHEQLGRVELPGVPVKLSTTPGAVRHLMEDVTLESLPPHVPSPPPFKAGWYAWAPLGGVRILDLGQFIAGTFAPTILANWGADVVKVEGLDGDPFRLAGLQFAGHNRGKRSLSVDLKSEEGRQVFFDLVRSADVVLDNFRNGVRERLGIAYETLRKVNPRIISCSVTGYGPEGPLRDDPGFDPLLQARSGMMAAQGGDDEPIFYKIAVNDSASAMMAAFSVVAALFARERTGEGQDVQTCLANQAILCQSGELTWYEGRPESPKGAKDCLGVTALDRLYACADGWLRIVCTKPEQFHQLCTALGHSEWAGRMTAEQALMEPAEGALGTLIGDVLAAMPRAEALDRLRSGGIPAAPVNSISEFFEDPWALQNQFFDTYEHPQFGPTTGPRSYAEFRYSGGGWVRGAPLLGEHSIEALSDWGIEPARIEALIRDGIVKQAPAAG